MQTTGRLTFSKKAYAEWVKQGAIQCKRYVGKFTSPELQGKSDTGLWYCEIQGQPHSIQGEGATPTAAIADALSRNSERIRALQTANATLSKWEC